MAPHLDLASQQWGIGNLKDGSHATRLPGKHKRLFSGLVLTRHATINYVRNY
jgi:hypothetical protein